MIGNLGYQSEWTDLGTGRVNMHARWYNPDTGQFDSRDSWSLSPAPDSVNANRYTYANQNPLTGTDPSGHYAAVLEGGYLPPPPPPPPPPGPDSSDTCGGAFDCFWEGLKSTFTISLDDILAIWNAIKNLGETFKGIRQEASGWAAKIKNLVGDRARIPDFVYATVGWICVITGGCEIVEDCVGLTARCMYHVGALAGNFIMGLITGGAAAAGARMVDRVRDFARKAMKDRKGGKGDGNGNRDGKDNDGGPTGTSPAMSQSNFAAKMAGRAADDAEIARPEPPKVPKRKNNGSRSPSSNQSSDGTQASGVPETCHSFDPSTLVLMADGIAKPISEVKLGDEVLATDPASGESGPQPVTMLHRNLDTDLTSVTVSSPAQAETTASGEGNGGRSTRGPTTLQTTPNHPFWDATTKAWVDAGDLTPGESTLIGPNAEIQHVVEVKSRVGSKYMYDLTVAIVHTYYVLAGSRPVLVHNNNNNDPCLRACWQMVYVAAGIEERGCPQRW